MYDDDDDDYDDYFDENSAHIWVDAGRIVAFGIKIESRWCNYHETQNMLQLANNLTDFNIERCVESIFCDSTTETYTITLKPNARDEPLTTSSRRVQRRLDALKFSSYRIVANNRDGQEYTLIEEWGNYPSAEPGL